MSKIHIKSKINCICCEEKIINGVFLHKTRRQTHSLCNICAEGYLNPHIEKITNNLRKNIKNLKYTIKCPGTYCGEFRNQCKKNINIKDIEINDKNSSLFTNIFRILYVNNNINVFICPNNDCGEILIIDYYIIYIKCISCETTWCKNCMCQPFHENMSCLENEIKKSNTKNSLYIKKMQKEGQLKLCPQCKAPTIKTKDNNGIDIGCNKILCSECNIKWCWLCNSFPVDYEHYNIKNKNNCANRLWEDTIYQK